MINWIRFAGNSDRLRRWFELKKIIYFLFLLKLYFFALFSLIILRSSFCFSSCCLFSCFFFSAENQSLPLIARILGRFLIVFFGWTWPCYYYWIVNFQIWLKWWKSWMEIGEILFPRKWVQYSRQSRWWKCCWHKQ